MKFEEAIATFTREQMYDLYINKGMSKEAVSKTIGISDKLVSKMLSYYEITKTKEQIQESKRKPKKRQFKVSKEVLLQEYIEQNMSYDDIRTKYGLTGYEMDLTLKEYGIKKDRAVSAKKGFKTKYEAYGSKEAYDAHVAEKAMQTHIEMHGSEEAYKKHLAKSVRSTVEARYGDAHYYNREAARKTCMERYGVPAACMLPQARMHGNDSGPNRKFALLLDEQGIVHEREFPLGGYSYDFKVGNILIEIDPWVTHNSTFSPFGREPVAKDYHMKKSRCAAEQGYRCIHVWDWDSPEAIVSLLHKRPVVYARNCNIVELDKSSAATFLNQHHLQGYADDAVRYGLEHGGNVVMVMTFGKPRYNSKFDWELIRLCSTYHVIGGDEKLFAHFKKCCHPLSVLSYCDMAKFPGNVYRRLGFTGNSFNPSRHWYNPETNQHYTDFSVRKLGVDKLLHTSFGKDYSNALGMIESGFVEIYDCGQQRFEYYTEMTNG